MTLINDYKTGVGGAPLTGASGLINSYSGQQYSPQGSQEPIYGSTGLITSYASSKSPAPKNNINPLDPTGKYEFDPYTGKNKQGLTKGEQSAKDYRETVGSVTMTKSPAVAAATDATLKTTQELAKTTVKSFSDYLQEAKQMQDASRASLESDQKTFATLPTKLESGLSDTVKQFAEGTSAINDQYKALNEQQAKQNADNIARLEQENQAYAEAARNVGQRAYDYASARNNIFQSASGTPTSDSGYGQQLAAKTYSDVMLPVEQQISQNRISQLTNYITPLQQQQYAQNLARLTGLELPVANSLASMGIKNANDVAQFTASLAGRSFSEQIQYLTSLGLPLQEAQRLLTVLPQSLAQLASIDQSNNWYTLTGDYQNPITAPLPTYSSGVPNGQPNTQPNNQQTNPFSYTNKPQQSYGQPATVTVTNPTGSQIQPYGPPVPPKPLYGPFPPSYYNSPQYGGGGGGITAGGQYFPTGNPAAGQPGITAGGQYFPAVDYNGAGVGDYYTM